MSRLEEEIKRYFHERLSRKWTVKSNNTGGRKPGPGTPSRACLLAWQCPVFVAPGTGFREDSVSMDPGLG